MIIVVSCAKSVNFLKLLPPKFKLFIKLLKRKILKIDKYISELGKRRFSKKYRLEKNKERLLLEKRKNKKRFRKDSKNEN